MPIRCASANRPPPPGILPPGRADSGVARACRCRATQFLLRRREDNLIKLRPSSLYHTVSRLAESGLIRQEGTERAGNRPERTTYSITEAGAATVRARLAEIIRRPVGGIRSFPSASPNRTTFRPTRSSSSSASASTGSRRNLSSSTRSARGPRTTACRVATGWPSTSSGTGPPTNRSGFVH
ncbi:PadR family transcriptional regulator [Rhodococcus pyridinivorans]